MGYIYNITFFVSKGKEDELLPLLRDDFKSSVLTGDSDAAFLHITRVMPNHSTGFMEGEEQAVSIGMQFSFPSVEALKKWSEKLLPSGFKLISERFGEDVLHFDTVLEIL